MNAREEVVNWLRDAYAMERGLEVTLKKISDSDKHPVEARHAAARHLEETRHHAQTVETLLHSLGSDTSSVKTGLGITTETLKGFTTAMSQDEPIKDAIASYAMEHFEIACYRSLALAAETAGLPEVSTACSQIIMDEEQMAETIQSMLPELVHQYLGGPILAHV